ncbi:Asp-tRNA(Asn)/Glu-tRNA(Gln) amidotransferase subunit GatB [bacterium]|jgi:aspartyl-tRNA(Asn)/glutamyl-tRNA(Gln) amidotransferase subunit B|nr:Asp-tRNA(Asn)/Glu-tRNA(Gln) amidotransferase subunit GatB [bacterium]
MSAESPLKDSGFEAVIGIEVHVQLKTNSKIFCSCQNRFGDPANANVCAVCSGNPGTLPVLNRKVVEYAMMVGLATGCKIAKISEFSRKHYLYPDLPKNYQITQDDRPICEDGFVPIELEGGAAKKIRLKRIHMEEDAGKNLHVSSTESHVDLNRAGMPLVEIVTEPDISSSYEAKAYLNRLHAIVQYLGVSDANMEEGSFRFDVNISVRPIGQQKLGTKVELKNINSFKFAANAIDYEIERQVETIETGGIIYQETRSWDSKNQKSFAMRSKEDAQEYRYFTDPDLPLLIIDDEWVENVRSRLPELPHEKLIRFQKEHKVSLYEAEILTSDIELAAFFEAVVEICQNAKHASNWILRNLLGYLKEHKVKLSEMKIKPDMLAELVEEVSKGIINSKIAQDVFAEMAETGKYPSIIIEEQGLEQIGSEDELEEIVVKIVADNPKVVEDYKSGKDRLFGFFVGSAMKATKGKGNPVVIQKLLKKHLS